MKKWRCVVCEFVHQGWKPPSHCPICGVQANMFEEVKEAENKDAEKSIEKSGAGSQPVPRSNSATEGGESE